MDYLYSLLNDIKEKKFKISIGTKRFKFTKNIKKDERYKFVKKWFNKKYIKEGYGIKSLIFDYNLPITYSSLRNFLKFMEIPLHTPNKANNFLKKRRSINARKQMLNKEGMYAEDIQKNIKSKKTTRGIQGYYWNSSKNKYVWLRSSWEFIYAKWLNKNKVIWDVEVKKYKLKNGSNYLPDFFIYDDNNEISKIVEIKGYWKNKEYKYLLLREQLNIEIALITDIVPYTDQNLKKEINLWRKLRKLGLKE